MFSTLDTIVAIATPPGRGGLGVVRLSGSRAAEIAQALTSRSAPLAARVATLTKVRDDATIDEVVVTLFVAPHSYTGEDVVEISGHGSPVLLERIMTLAIGAGARLAEPGEFTLRAFLNGRIDLMQAEAVGDLIDAATPLQARAAFDQLDGTLTRTIGEIDAALFDLIARLEASVDFPDEGYHFVEPAAIVGTLDGIIGRIDTLLADAARGRMLREGVTVVIAGRPNVGKSSLFNALLGTDRAIVTDVPGTTRDLVAERVDIGGLAVTLVDTAGARPTVDPIEREGVARSAQARAASSLVLVILDQSEELSDDDRHVLDATRERPRLIVKNKSDRPDRCDTSDLAASVVSVSARSGDGLAALREAIAGALTTAEPLSDTPAITNTRHVALLDDARTAISKARTAAQAAAPEEFIAADLQQARERLDEIVGRRTSDDVLRHIFERFCIGK